MEMLRSLVLAVVVATTAGQWLNGDDSVDRAYGDLPNMPIALNASSQPSDCAKLCLASGQCVAWAYCKPRCGGSGDQPSCYLKEKVMVQSYNPCRVHDLQCVCVCVYTRVSGITLHAIFLHVVTIAIW